MRKRKTIWLETSSYLPLVWRTPYSRSVVQLMEGHAEESEFLLQRDCVREAAGYLAFEDNWRYHPAIRFRRLADRLSERELRSLPYPSTAVQLLLGGNIWPQAQYLNFVRHTAFFFIDLLDGVSFEDPRSGLTECARRIEERVKKFRQLFHEHQHASELHLPRHDILSYWGTWYLDVPEKSFTIALVDDPRPYNLATDKLRDVYHYDCAISSTPPPSLVLVANTQFVRNVRTSFSITPCLIVCAKTCSAEIFGDT